MQPGCRHGVQQGVFPLQGTFVPVRLRDLSYGPQAQVLLIPAEALEEQAGRGLRLVGRAIEGWAFCHDRLEEREARRAPLERLERLVERLRHHLARLVEDDRRLVHAVMGEQISEQRSVGLEPIAVAPERRDRGRDVGSGDGLLVGGGHPIAVDRRRLTGQRCTLTELVGARIVPGATRSVISSPSPAAGQRRPSDCTRATGP